MVTNRSSTMGSGVAGVAVGAGGDDGGSAAAGGGGGAGVAGGAVVGAAAGGGGTESFKNLPERSPPVIEGGGANVKSPKDSGIQPSPKYTGENPGGGEDDGTDPSHMECGRVNGNPPKNGSKITKNMVSNKISAKDGGGDSDRGGAVAGGGGGGVGDGGGGGGVGDGGAAAAGAAGAGASANAGDVVGAAAGGGVTESFKKFPDKTPHIMEGGGDNVNSPKDSGIDPSPTGQNPVGVEDDGTDTALLEGCRVNGNPPKDGSKITKNMVSNTISAKDGVGVGGGGVGGDGGAAGSGGGGAAAGGGGGAVAGGAGGGGGKELFHKFPVKSPPIIADGGANVNSPKDSGIEPSHKETGQNPGGGEDDGTDPSLLEFGRVNGNPLKNSGIEPSPKETGQNLGGGLYVGTDPSIEEGGGAKHHSSGKGSEEQNQSQFDSECEYGQLDET